MTQVLHVIDTTGPGGAETVFVELADRLRGDGFQSIVLLRGPGWVRDALQRRGLDPILLDAKGSFNWRYLLALQTLIRRQQIDIIQSHLLGSNVYCALAGWLTRRPVVATFHGPVDIGPNERWRELKFWLMRRGVSQYVTVSRSLKATLQKAGLLDLGRSRIIYNGVDPRPFNRPRHRRLIQELNLPGDAILIGSLGNVRPAKAYDVLIRAAVELCRRDPRLYFLVAGDIMQSVMQPLEVMLGELNLHQRVRFLGFRHDTADYLRGLDVFVLSSSSEGFSIATIEAQAAGLPVIATRSGGPEEIVENGKTGLLVAINDPSALADAVWRVISDQRLAEHLGQAGQIAVTQRFAMEGMIEQYADLYRQLMTGATLK